MSTYYGFELCRDTPGRVPEVQFHETTMQVPCGQYSIFAALRDGEVTAAETIVYLSLNHGSSWNTGRTWYVSHRVLADRIGMSPRYVRAVLDELQEKGWLIPISMTNKRQRYQLVHHLCDDEEVPVDQFGRPLKFAVPRGMGGPFERLYFGEISWKACLVWIRLKLHSDWKTGETFACTMIELGKLCRMRPKSVCGFVKELSGAEMLKRLSKPCETSVFQLYPKPRQASGSVKEKSRKSKPRVYDIKTDGVHWYSRDRPPN